MVESKKKKSTITEEDISLLLQRYSETTILTLLQEIYQLSSERIDWNTVAKRTLTGISCPRECQMIWRHLAYHDPLMEKIEDGAEPLDDDSDLEIELEALPAVSAEAAAEAAACVKVLMSSGSPNDSGATNRPSIEAPLIINIPNGSTRGLNATIPVSVQKQFLPALTPVEGLDGNGPTSSRQPAKKKRKLWTKEEDDELIAAVEKFGEGNWQNILKEDFTFDRTASQLSQRWSILRKQKQLSKSNAGSGSNPNNPTLTDAQLNTREALSRALNMPMISGLSAMGSGSMQPSNPSGSVLPGASSEASPLSTHKATNQSQPALEQPTSQKGLMPASNKSRITQTKPPGPAKPSTGLNSLIQKAAFAAGGRIANPSTAASLLKAAQSKSAVHIRPGGALPITQVSVGKPSPSANSVAPRQSSTSQTRMLPPGMVPSSSGPGSQLAACSSAKPPSQMPSGTATLSQPFPQQLSGDSAVPVCDDTRENTDGMSVKAVPTDAISVLSKGEVEVAEQVKTDSSSDLDQVIITEQANCDGSSVQGQATVVEQMKFDSSFQQDQVAVLNVDVNEGMLDCVMDIQATSDDHLLVKTACAVDGDQGAVVDMDVVENLNPGAHQAVDDQSLTDQNLVTMPDVDMAENIDSVADHSVDVAASVGENEPGDSCGKLLNNDDPAAEKISHKNQNMAGVE